VNSNFQSFNGGLGEFAVNSEKYSKNHAIAVFERETRNHVPVGGCNMNSIPAAVRYGNSIVQCTTGNAAYAAVHDLMPAPVAVIGSNRDYAADVQKKFEKEAE
jgi:hypothetical protein